MGNNLASGVLEAIAICLRKQKEKNLKLKYALIITSEVTGMQN